MRLAGQIRLKTFVALVAVGSIAVCFGAVGVLMLVPVSSDAPMPSLTGSSPGAMVATVSPGWAASTSVRPFDADILVWQHKAIDGGKLKDAIPGGVKVNLYQDPGMVAMNRAKVDFDRDERWDETWTFDPDGAVTREAAPEDDENYTLKYRWAGDAWAPMSVDGTSPPIEVAEDPSASSEPPVELPAGAVSLRPADHEVLAWRGKNLGTDKIKDATVGQPYKVNVYQDAGNPAANRVKLDLDRDDKWDEKFTFSPEGVERQVAPADDEAYTEVYALVDAAWVRK